MPGDENRAQLSYETLGKVLKLSELLSAAAEHDLGGTEGLTRARAGVIWRLGNGGPMTLSALSHELEVTPRNVTGLVDALEAGGFVAREPHPTDRRATIVALTTTGRAAADRMSSGYQHLAEVLFQEICSDDLASFSRTLGKIMKTFLEVEPSANPRA